MELVNVFHIYYHAVTLSFIGTVSITWIYMLMGYPSMMEHLTIHPSNFYVEFI
jgi:hypothetical protein